MRRHKAGPRLRPHGDPQKKGRLMGLRPACRETLEFGPWHGPLHRLLRSGKGSAALGSGIGGALQGRHEMPARDVENIREKALCPARCNANGAADLACHGDQRRLAGYAVRAKTIFS